MQVSVLQFCQTAQALASEAHRLGLVVPGFRSPPRLAGVDRTIRRGRGGGAVVAVRRRGRGFDATLGDMIEGIVTANRLSGARAEAARAALHAAALTLEPPPYPNR